MSWDKNMYSHPEKFGLTVVADFDKSSGCYEYDSFVVWKDAAGKHYWAADSGCSCPTPFDDCDPESVPQGSYEDAVNDARAWLGTEPEYQWRDEDWTRAKQRMDEVFGAGQ